MSKGREKKREKKNPQVVFSESEIRKYKRLSLKGA